MNKNTKRYLAYGINYQNSTNWDFPSLNISEYGLSLDDNKIRNIMGVFNDYSTKTEVG